MKSLLILFFCSFAICYAQVKLGKIEVNAESSSLILPAKVNQTEGIVEFLLVYKNGKIHESLFSTEITAIEFNAALNLLGLKTDQTKKSDIPKIISFSELPSLKVFVSDSNQTKWQPATSFVQYKGKSNMPDVHPWHYNGSYFYNNNFMAEVEGDLIAIYTNVNALINLEHPDRTDDTVWFANAQSLEEKDTPVFLKIIVEQ